MFAIITNYKKLTLSLFKSELNHDAPGQVSNGNGFKEENGTNIDDLVQKILSDERIDSADKDYLINLEKELNSDKNEVYKNTKEKTKLIMKDVLNQVLDNGFHIKNEESLVSLQKMAAITGMDLPDFSNEIGSRITKEEGNDTIYLYNEGLISMGYDLVDFQYNKVDGKYKKVRSGEKVNLSYNDNTFEAHQKAAAVYLDAKGDQAQGVKSKALKEDIDKKNVILDGLIATLNEKTNLTWTFDIILNKIKSELSDRIILPELNGTSYTIEQKISIVTDFNKIIKVEQKSNIITKNIEFKDLPKNLEKFRWLSDKVVYTLDLGQGNGIVNGKITALQSYTSGNDTTYEVTINNKNYTLNSETALTNNTNVKAAKLNKIDSNKKTIEWNKKRYSNKEVIAIQLALGIDSDGKFGPNTLSAVKKFQSDNNLKVDGKIGKMTLKRLGVDFKKKESGSKNKVATYEDFRGNVKEITVKKIDFTDDNNQEKSKYKVELEDSTGSFHNDIEWTFDHFPTKADIQSVVDKFHKVEKYKEEFKVMVGKLKFKPSEVKELEALGIDYEEIVADKEYQLDRKGLWSNDFKISVNKEGKFIVKDTDGRIELTVDANSTLTETLVKVDKVLKAMDLVSNPGADGFKEGSKEELLEEYFNGLNSISNSNDLGEVIKTLSSMVNVKEAINKQKKQLTKQKEKLSKGEFEISSFEEKDGEIIVKLSGVEGLNEYSVDGEFEGKKITHHNVQTGEEFTSIANEDKNQFYTVRLNTGINDGVSDSETIVKLDTNKYGVGYIDKANYLKAQKKSIKKYIQKQNEK